MANKTLKLQKSLSSKKLKEQIIILNKIAFNNAKNLQKENFAQDKNVILIKLFAIFEAAMKENILHFYDQTNTEIWSEKNKELNKKPMPFGKFESWQTFLHNYHKHAKHKKYETKIKELFRSHVEPIYELRNNISHNYFNSSEKEISAPEYLDAIFSLIQMHNVVASIFSCAYKITKQHTASFTIQYNFTINND